MWEEIELKGWEIEMSGKTVTLKKDISNKEKAIEHCFIKIVLFKDTPLDLRLSSVEVKAFGHSVFRISEIPELLSLFEDIAMQFLNRKKQE